MDETEEIAVPRACPKSVVFAASALCIATASASAQLQPQNVLLVYNSENADSLAIRNAYIAARPGVLQFDLDDPTIGPGFIGRGDYLTKIRAPIRNFINGTAPNSVDISAQIMSIATTRGLPAVIWGANEFDPSSSFAGLESELTLLQQDLEQSASSGSLAFQYSGMVDNPYHRIVGTRINTYSRANVKTLKSFVYTDSIPTGFPSWVVTDLTPGDIYLVCRLDAAPTPGGGNSALQNTLALITRSTNLQVTPCQAQALFDEDANGTLDNGGVPPRYPSTDDFSGARAVMSSLGYLATRDTTNNFVTGPELANQIKPLVMLGSYGENHDLSGGENPPGNGTYLQTYTFHPAAFFVSYESFNGNSIIDGTQRDDHAQALDFIALGGSFTVAHVREPYSFTPADLQMIAANMFQRGFTFAEAAYTSIACLSWQLTPVGDPLATIAVVPPAPTDLDCNLRTDVEDLYIYNGVPRDVTGDSQITIDDMLAVRNTARSGEATSVATR